MALPASLKKLVPSEEILGSAARRLQQSVPILDDDETSGDKNRQKEQSSPKMLRAVNTIWSCIGLVVEHSLLSAARGVRIESLGTFTLDSKGRARFCLAADFAARHRLVEYDVGPGLPGGAVNTRINVARVAATAGRPRPEAERVLAETLRSLHRHLAAGRPVQLSFHPVAIFSCTPSGRAGMKFLAVFRAKQKRAAVFATRARIGVARTKATPTPWGAASAGNITAAEGGSVGRRPHSAAPGSSRRFASDRPNTSHGFGHKKHSSALSNGTTASNVSSCSTTCNSSLVKVSVERATTRAGPGEAFKSPPSRPGSKQVCQMTKRALSCSSLCSSPDGRFASCAQQSDASGRKTRVDDAAIHAQEGVISEDSGHMQRSEAGEGDAQTKKLAGLLRRRTLAQAGDEGLRRLVETIKLGQVSSERGSSGGGGRLSGKDLLMALRDAGTTLTSAELAWATSLFGRQPDGRIPSPAFLAGLGTGKQNDTATREGPAGRYSPSTACKKKVEAAVSSSHGTVATAVPSGLPWERPLCQKTPPEPCPHVGQAPEGGKRGRECPLSSPRLSESFSTGRALREMTAAGQPSGDSSGRDIGQSKIYTLPRKPDIGSRDPENGNPRSSVEQATSVAARPAGPQLAPRECWGVEIDGREGAGSAGKSAAARDAIADLARIVFHPPSSLERLLHVLQANKVNEQPTISCTALAARLVQMRPGLGKARAKELAAAACRYPDKQVDLVKLHALLERRFGRCGRGGFCGRTPHTRSGDGGGTSRSTSASAISVSSSPSSSLAPSLSLTAVDRVRRKLLVSRRGLVGLRDALNSVGGGGGGGEAGRLTKDELRCALAAAGGAGSAPPTAEDVDELFTLFSGGDSGGVGGRRVDAATVLRGLRGELNPFRERVVRDVFRNLLRQRTAGGRNGNGSGAGKVGAGAAVFGGAGGEGRGGSSFQGNSINATNRGSGGDAERGGAGLGGWCSSGDQKLGGDNGVYHAMLAGDANSGDAAGGGAILVGGFTEEQFLEHCRDVSAGIDGDDAFELAIRSAWSPRRRPLPRSGYGSCGRGGCGAAAEVEVAGEEGGTARLDIENCFGAACSATAPVPSPSRRGKGQGTTTEDGLGVKLRSGIPRGSPRLSVPLRPPVKVELEREIDAEQEQRGDGSHRVEQRSHEHSLGAKGESMASCDGLDSQDRYQQQHRQLKSPQRHQHQHQQQYQQQNQHQHKQQQQQQQRRVKTTCDTPDRAAAAAAAAAASGHRRGGRSQDGRPAAATRVQSLFRGHKGRTRAAAEARKRARRLAEERNLRDEQQRPRAAAARRLGGRIIRPKGPSTYGF